MRIAKARRAAFWIALISLTLLLGLGPRTASAQILYGSLVGNVSDDSGAAIPGAQVSITNEETGAVRTGQSNASGVYNFPTVATGNYTVEIRSDGFRTHSETGVAVGANDVTRVDIGLQIGQVTETIEVSAGALRLQTDRAEVRAEVDKQDLQTVPVPLGRNYQMLMQTIPGFSPPQNAHSVPANPTRAVRFSVNGTSDQSNNVRIDGATNYNPNLTHMSGINPALEAIEVVNVVTSSFDAEQGLAGGASINIQIKSGTNDVHGSAFWYHNNQKLQAYPYFSDRTANKPKFIYNQAGATIGGPIKKNRAFYFFSYERTAEHSNATRFRKVPDAAMRAGDFSASPFPIFDPMSTAVGSEADRTPFANNIIPESRIASASRILADSHSSGDWHLPNRPGTGSLGLNNNYNAGITYAFDRHQIDSKTNLNLSDNWTMFARLSFFYFDQVNPGAFGNLSGISVHPTNFRTDNGFGPTYSGTISTTYVAKPNLVFDAYFGSMLLDSNAFAANLDQNIGTDLLGIPGTNSDGLPGPGGSFYGGMPRMRFDSGFGNLGYQATSPFIGHDFQHQIAFNGNWTTGNHEVRFGTDTFLSNINQEVANFPGGDAPAGGFFFRDDTTSRAGTGTNDYNTIASFMLGLPREAARNFLTGKNLQTRAKQYSLYIRDRWQVKPNLTLSYGTRWEFYPIPRRPDRGLERFDIDNNIMFVCGVGSTPANCDLPQSKKLFAPRVGIAWRVSDTFVVRTGYGLTYDPFNLGRDLRGNLPTQFSQRLAVPNSRSYSTTLSQGLPPIPAVPVEAQIQQPLTANVATIDGNYSRGYVQSWNFTLEKRINSWIASAGYVATRSVRQSARLEANWSDIGTGNAGRVLRQAYGRTANTLFWGALGTPKYDALQMKVTRRAGGHTFNLAYTWSHGRGYTDESSSAQPRARHPLYYGKNYGDLNEDIRHNFVLSNSFELPFGRGQKFATSGPAAAILGGWQVNALASLRTGRPSTATAPNGSLNSQGSSQYGDCLAPVRKIGKVEQWWDPASFANPAVTGGTPRFGTCGSNTLRGPGLINVDMGIFRKFTITERIDLQFRAEAFNISNTPHFNNPNSNVASSDFGLVTAVQNTGREGLDQRVFRFGLRLGW